MTPAEMDKELGLTNRMRKVGNNLRKFQQLEGEEANLQNYHYDMIDRGVAEIQRKVLEFIVEEWVRNLVRVRAQ